MSRKAAKVEISEAVADKRENYFRDQIQPHGKRYKHFHPLSVEVIYHLVYTYDVVTAHLAQNLTTFNLSLSALNVMMILSRNEGRGCPLHELSDLLLVSRANITGLVDCLEKRGLVERVMAGDDRRIRRAQLTVAGSQMLDALLPGHYRHLYEACSEMADADKKKLVKLLTKFRKSVQASARNFSAGRKTRDEK